MKFVFYDAQEWSESESESASTTDDWIESEGDCVFVRSGERKVKECEFSCLNLRKEKEFGGKLGDAKAPTVE